MGGYPTQIPGRHKDPKLIGLARKLRTEGRTIDYISKQTGISHSTVHEITKGIIEPPYAKECEFCGATFITDVNNAKYCTSKHARLAATYRKRRWDYSTYPRTNRKWDRVPDIIIQEAKELRAEGKSSYAICDALGMCTSSLVYHGILDIEIHRNCLHCDAPFVTFNAAYEYCEKHRVEKLRRKIRPKRVKVCPHCGEVVARLTDKVLESPLDENVLI